MSADITSDKQPSGTAAATAFLRALAAHDPSPEVRGRDTMAEIFLPEEQRKPLHDRTARGWVLQNRIMPGAYEFMLARTAFFDRVVEQALQANIDQMIFLGAGYDSRPYRFTGLIRDTIIFELDMQPTQQHKQECLRQAGIPISSQIRFVPLDFNTDPLAGKLAVAGFDSRKETVFVWEGVTYYLAPEAVDGMLTFVAENSPPGSSICFDYAAISQETLDEPNGKEIRSHMRSQYANEPARFGIPAGWIESFLDGRGFEILEHLTAAEMGQSYLPQGSLQELGQVPQMFCLVHARVKK
jgi:methyltransferase (TIGR00027 family)